MENAGSHGKITYVLDKEREGDTNFGAVPVNVKLVSKLALGPGKLLHPQNI